MCLHRCRSKILRSVLPSHLQKAGSLMPVLLQVPSWVREERGLLQERSRKSTQYELRDWGADADLGQQHREKCSQLSLRLLQIVARSRFLALGKRVSLVTKLSPALPRERFIDSFSRAAMKKYLSPGGLHNRNSFSHSCGDGRPRSRHWQVQFVQRPLSLAYGHLPSCCVLT